MDTFFGCVGGKIRLLRCVLLVAFCAVRSVLLHALGIRCVVAVRPFVVWVPVSVHCPLMLGEQNHPKAENVSKTQNLSFCLTENTTPLYYKDMSIQTYSASVDSGLSISSLVEVGNLRPSHCIRTLARKCAYLSFLISIVINLYLLSTVVTFKLYVFSSNLGEGGSST